MKQALRIRCYPDPVLRRRSRAVSALTPELAARVEEMFAVMDEEGGIGLAAPQVGWGVRLFVTRIPVGEAEGPRRVYVNPEIVTAEGQEEAEEGCLSFPDIRAKVTRHTRVVLRARDLRGEEFEEEGTGLTARCWEHELDHLDGILFITRFKAGDLLAAKQKLAELEEKYVARAGREKKGRA